MRLQDLGFDPFFEESFSPFHEAGLDAARVAFESRESYRVLTAGGELTAELSGKLRFQADSREDLPATGDWVAIQAFPGQGEAVIHAVLPRRSRLVRAAAGTRAEAQVIGANVDTLFAVMSLVLDFNPRRLERYLAVAREGGVEPVVVLTKSDLVPDAAPLVREAGRVAAGAAVLAVSATRGDNLEGLAPWLTRGRTAALAGSSGAGKSTLVNRLAGVALAVSPVRERDGRGRHTTTSRELVVLPSGALVLDTPGMRELALWDGEGLDEAFDDVAVHAAACRFRDCRHEREPDCAVRAAAASGALDPERLRSHEKLRREAAYQEALRTQSASFVEKTRWKRLTADMKRRERPG